MYALNLQTWLDQQFSLQATETEIRSLINADFVGGATDDRVVGADDQNLIDGGDGNDRLFGGLGDDALLGGAGNDTLIGGAGNDFLSGGAGNDFLMSDYGNSWLEGGAGDDRIIGGRGQDVLIGGVGEDVLKGRAGNDVIIGGAGSDRIVGGGGVDVAVMQGLVSDFAIDIHHSHAMVYQNSYQDTLIGIEFIQFDDALVSLAEAFGTRINPWAWDDSVAVLEDELAEIDVTANDLDDKSLQVASVGPANHGEVFIVNDGTVLYRPTKDYSGEDQFTYAVVDTNGNTSEATVYIVVEPQNDPAIANQDIFVTASGSDMIEGSLIANDVDPEGEPLSVQTESGITASGGSFEIESDGTFSYQAVPGFSGTEHLEYTLVDAAGAETQGNIAITVMEAAPVDDVDRGSAIRALATELGGPPQRPEPSGRELWVGEGEEFASLREVSEVTTDGDTIFVRAGTYLNDYATFNHSVSIIGVGGKAEFQWESLTSAEDPKSWVPEGKTWIPNSKGIINIGVKAGDVYIENLSLSGANVTDKNGAGIRHHGKDLTVVNSIFTNNENGILAIPSTPQDAIVRVYGSEFYGNGYQDGKAHAMYVKGGHLLIVENSKIVDTVAGHHVKAVTDNLIVRNSILDDGDGDSSYAVDATSGGDVLVEGNSITQGANAGNGIIIHYSVARGGDSGDVAVHNNTFVNELSGANILRNTSEFPAVFKGNTFENRGDGWLELGAGLSVFQNNIMDGAPMADIDALSGATVFEGSTLQVDMATNSATGDGDDLAVLGRGNDSLQAGADDDIVFGQTGKDWLYGQDGEDTLVGGRSNDALFGGTGNDALFGSDGADTLVGGDGDDYLHGARSWDNINGGDGIDVAIYRARFAEYSIREAGGRNFVKADKDMADHGRDALVNVELAQFLDGVFDFRTGEFHENMLLIEPELFKAPTDPFAETQDYLKMVLDTGVVGNLVRGTTVHNEVVIGTDEADILYGGGGNAEILRGGLGDDVYVFDEVTLLVSEAEDEGTDTIVVTGDWATLHENVEVMKMIGDEHAKGIGNELDNTLLGNAGRNYLDGDAGDDIIDGGASNDTLVGGEGHDTFQFSGSNVGSDFIRDFNLEEDMITYDQGLVGTASVSEVVASIEDGEYGARLSIGDLTITLAKIVAADLTEAHFGVL